MTIDSVLEQVRANLHLSKEEEWELIEEIRTHLEDAVSAAESRGKDRTTALLKAAEEFGVDESAFALQQVHKDSQITQVVLMCVLPIFFTVVLRWLIFSADGTTANWSTLFTRPTIVTVTSIVLIIPLALSRRWPYVAAMWLLFWGVSVIFMLAS